MYRSKIGEYTHDSKNFISCFRPVMNGFGDNGENLSPYVRRYAAAFQMFDMNVMCYWCLVANAVDVHH